MAVATATRTASTRACPRFGSWASHDSPFPHLQYLAANRAVHGQDMQRCSCPLASPQPPQANASLVICSTNSTDHSCWAGQSDIACLEHPTSAARGRHRIPASRQTLAHAQLQTLSEHARAGVKQLSFQACANEHSDCQNTTDTNDEQLQSFGRYRVPYTVQYSSMLPVTKLHRPCLGGW